MIIDGEITRDIPCRGESGVGIGGIIRHNGDRLNGDAMSHARCVHGGGQTSEIDGEIAIICAVAIDTTSTEGNIIKDAGEIHSMSEFTITGGAAIALNGSGNVGVGAVHGGSSSEFGQAAPCDLQVFSALADCDRSLIQHPFAIKNTHPIAQDSNTSRIKNGGINECEGGLIADGVSRRQVNLNV